MALGTNPLVVLGTWIPYVPGFEESYVLIRAYDVQSDGTAP